MVTELKMTEELSKYVSFIFLNSLHICFYPDPEIVLWFLIVAVGTNNYKMSELIHLNKWITINWSISASYFLGRFSRQMKARGRSFRRLKKLWKSKPSQLNFSSVVDLKNLEQML